MRPRITHRPIGDGAHVRARPRFDGLRATPDEYLALPDDGWLYDMVDGVLRVSPSPLYEHNYALGSFQQLIRNFLDRHPVGEAVCETDVFLPDGGDVLRPDLSFIATERLHIVRGHIHGAPDLVVEILSEHSAARDLGIKSERYLQNGVREYWLADPRDRSLRVRYAARGAWVEEAGPVLASRSLAGLAIRAAQLFRPAPPTPTTDTSS